MYVEIFLFQNYIFVSPGNQVAPTSSYYGAGSSVVQFGNVQCVGNETSLLDCSYNSTAQCSSTQQAGVLCPHK